MISRYKYGSFPFHALQATSTVFDSHFPPDKFTQKMMCGGLGERRAATEEIQKLCDQFKREVEENAGKVFDSFTAVSYRTQVVSGTNYFIKVHAGENEYLHIQVYSPLPHTKQPQKLAGHQGGKSLEDEICHF